MPRRDVDGVIQTRSQLAVVVARAVATAAQCLQHGSSLRVASRREQVRTAILVRESKTLLGVIENAATATPCLYGLGGCAIRVCKNINHITITNI